jgi:lipooligosaccharide transport system ATP-binding protein
MGPHLGPVIARAEGDAAVEPQATLVVARGLTKRFGDFTAVDGIDFDVRAGEVFGFLGPNGAGKTSTMRMIAAVSPLTSGSPGAMCPNINFNPNRHW